MKLRQAQVWKEGDRYIRIVQLERLTVSFKSMKTPNARDGTHNRVTKKEFCRLLKTATLLTPGEDSFE